MAKAIVPIVTGIPETVSGLDAIAKLDYSKAETRAGRAVLSSVKSGTRHDTGALQGAWSVDGGAFVNNESYASYQEFGTRFVPATFALFRAWDEKQSEVEKAFLEEIEDAATKAGLDS
jgi:hypothetical protein